MSRSSEKETLEGGPAGVTPDGRTFASTRVLFEHLPTGTLLGRYVILELVGAGGMGVVYAAYDPKLDRRVALKLVRGEGPDAADANARLLREAQALAKLSHANVVAVHDASIVGEAVCIEMEYVDGVTLDVWVRDKKASEVLAAYLQAGRALAAAHEAGLVHRDFKPANAVVDATGRVRVLDFGLARAVHDALDGDARPLPEEKSHPSLPPPADDPELVRATPSIPSVVRPTLAGMTVGTPAFMPPEQWQGRAVDARADQYAFAASLFEAAYGVLPFPHASRKAMRSEKARGAMTPRPSKTPVPAYVHRALTRALAFSPSDRFATMDALVEALARDPAAKRRKRVLAATAAVVLACVAVLATRAYRARDAAVCGAMSEKLNGAWDATKMEAVHAAITRGGKPGAEAAWQHTKAALDAYASAWLQMRTATCEEQRRSIEPVADAAIGVRLVCLDWRLRDLRALTDVLASDATLVHESAQAVSGLPAIEECAHASAIAALKPSEDPVARARADEVRALIAEAESLRLAARPKAARPIAQRAVESARDAKLSAVEAAALFVLGKVEESDGSYAAAATTLEQAVWAAEAAPDDRTLAEATTQLAWVVGYRQADRVNAARWERHASAAVERIGAPDALAAELDHVRSALARQRQDLPEALTLAERFLLRVTRARGARHPRVASAEHNLANTYMALARLDDAMTHFEKSREIIEAAYGPEHPSVATSLASEALVLRRQGDHAAAIARYGRALAILVAARGPDHPDVAITTGNMGVALAAAGRLDEAHDHATRALEIRLRALGPDHPMVASSLTGVATLDRRRKHYAEARGKLERAAQIYEKAGGKQNAALGAVFLALADLSLDENKPGEALALAQRAHDVRLEALGPDHPDVGSALTALGKCHLALHDATRALAPLERALEILADRSPRSLADAQFLVARALRDVASDPARARTLAAAAEAVFAKDESATKEDLAEVRAWTAANERWLSSAR